MNPFCWQDYCTGTLEAIAANGTTSQPAKVQQSHHKDKLPADPSASDQEQELLTPAPLPPTLLHSPLCGITTCQSKATLLDQGEHSTATALCFCSPWVLPVGRWKQHCYLPRRKREWFGIDDSTTSAWCPVTSRPCLPLREPLLFLKEQQKHEIRGRGLITAM